MTLIAFLTATLTLLIAPGPTNTLMAVAAAQRGLGYSARLIPAELAGYLMAILPLGFLGAQVVQNSPAFAIALQSLAAIWVMYLALKMWNLGAVDGDDTAVSARRIFVTTLLNPKALIFGLVLLPGPAAADYLPRLWLFGLMVIAVALLWGTAGLLTQSGQRAGQRLHFVQRFASVWLGFVSVSLVVRLIGT